MTSLFFGTDAPEKITHKALYKLFTSNKNYLKEWTFNQKTYLGKELPPILSYEEINGHKEHILSLLKRIFPEQKFSNDDFFFFHDIHR